MKKRSKRTLIAGRITSQIRVKNFKNHLIENNFDTREKCKSWLAKTKTQFSISVHQSRNPKRPIFRVNKNVHCFPSLEQDEVIFIYCRIERRSIGVERLHDA